MLIGDTSKIELEFGCVGFLGEGKTRVPGEKPLGARTRTNNKLNPHMTPGPGVEPGPHWWKASALTTAPSLLPIPAPPASLPFIFINPEVVVYKVSSTQVFYKLLVVCDNHKLKVPLLLSSSDNSAKKNPILHLKCQRVSKMRFLKHLFYLFYLFIIWHSYANCGHRK